MKISRRGDGMAVRYGGDWKNRTQQTKGTKQKKKKK